MRESVLLALIHIFAIITVANQKGISEKGRRIFRNYLKKYLNREDEEEYYSLFENNLEFYLAELKSINLSDLRDENSPISFQVQNVCRQVNKGLLLEERMIVFLQLLEFTTEDGVTTEVEKSILDITAKTFDIPSKEYDNAVAFITGRMYDEVSPGCLLIIESDIPERQTGKIFSNYNQWQHIRKNRFRGQLFILHIESTNALLMVYEGDMVLSYRGSDIIPFRTYILERGVNIKGHDISPIYYSRIYKKFLSRKKAERIVFEGYDIEYAFSRSVTGLNRMSFMMESGNLVGLMGGSGVGKTTLLNILSGKAKPSKGNIFINGYNLHTDSAELSGLIGYVPQDDLLMEELTVYQNLYFNARFCFGNYNEDQLNGVIDKVLTDLDLQDIKHLQVGDPLNKKISGGQRKRLNIGLELMREPVILFLDEPTSGLSSFDSENVMSLLKKQALNGKLVFTIIHQPSSSVLKMFDRLWILDKGGYMVYDGDPVEALVYLKTETSLVNAAESECPNCGNIETDDILKIIESKVIEDSGQEGRERLISPQEWYERYKAAMMPAFCMRPEKYEIPLSDFKVPAKKEQFKTFIKRNIARKFSDRQYISLNILEAPILALILGYISKSSIDDTYIFASNENYYIFLFMAVIVSLFIGLTVSAFEIFRDRKILEREKFLNIARSSYLFSKTIFLFGLSAIQTLLFIIVANSLLEVKGMFFQQWIILFSTSCFGNLLGMNISAGMKTSDSIYVLIPLLLIPMLILGGAMIQFDDLHKSLTRKIYVPVIGDAMVTRWSYEAIMVEQFRNNKFEKPFFEYDMEISQNDWTASFLIPALKVKADECRAAGKEEVYRENSEDNLNKLRFHITDLSSLSGLKPGKWFDQLNYDEFNEMTWNSTRLFLDSLQTFFRGRSRVYNLKRDSVYNRLKEQLGDEKLSRLRDEHYNEHLTNVVLNRYSTFKIYDSDHKLIQKSDPAFMKPGSRYGRAHYYAPYKQLGKLKINTLIFNTIAIWLMITFLYIALYYDLLKRFVTYLDKLELPFSDKLRKLFLPVR